MKRILRSSCFFLVILGIASNAFAEIAPDVERLATAIGYAENSKTHPYGILAPYCTGRDPKRCRKGCVQTIQKRLRLWSGEGDFIKYLSRSYAPARVANDPHGLNRFWVKNVKYWYKKTEGIKNEKSYKQKSLQGICS